MFTRNGGEWIQQAKLAAEDGDTDDLFGWSVAISDGTALIGAPTDEDPNGSEAGAAYVFTRDGGEWSQQAKLAAEDGDMDDRFGRSIAVDGDTAVVGAWQDEDPNGSEAGTAYVFTRDGGEWIQQAKLAAGDGEMDDRFGWAVTIAGDTALVGASRAEESDGAAAFVGAVYVFERTGEEWSQQAKLTANDGDAADLFGSSVMVAGDTVIIGASRDDDPNGSDAGAAYVFTRDGGEWSQQTKLAADDGDTGDRFGWSVALDGDTALVGAYRDEDPNGTFAGAAYVYNRAGGSWTQQTKLAAANGEAGDRFGWAVALADDTTLVGSPKDDTPNGPAAGAAYVFSR